MIEKNTVRGSVGKTLLIVIIVIGVLILCCAGAGLSGILGTASVVEEQQKEQANKEEQIWNNPKKLNEKITVGNIDWTVVEAQNLGSTLKSKYGQYGTDCNANSGKFVKVTVKVKNNDKEIRTLTNVDLFDSQKREFKISSDVFGCVDGDVWILENINPGIEKTYVAVYEVPSDAKNLRLKVGDMDLLSDEYEYIELGL